MNTALNGGLFGIAVGAAIGGSVDGFVICFSIWMATTLICRTMQPVTTDTDGGGVR